MDSATVSDHFQPWRREGGHAPFSLAWMTAVGERTERLILGTSVLTPTFRYNPRSPTIPTPKKALANTRFWAPLSLTAEQKHSINDPIEMEKAADALPIEQVAKRWIVASDPDEAVEMV